MSRYGVTGQGGAWEVSGAACQSCRDSTLEVQEFRGRFCGPETLVRQQGVRSVGLVVCFEAILINGLRLFLPDCQNSSVVSRLTSLEAGDYFLH